MSNSRTLAKAMDLLIALGSNAGHRSFSDVAGDVGIPFSTARRFGAVLEDRGLIVRQQAGRYLPGPALLDMAETMPRRSVFVALARPVLTTLAREAGMTAHLGVMEEQMVTYVCKAGDGVFTREGMQLEAYCSGVGKVLLAAMTETELGQYLADGELVALTPRTIVDPTRLREELIQVWTRGWAMETGEVIEGLACLAIPVRDPEGGVWAGLSVSGRQQSFSDRSRDRLLASLAKAASALASLPVQFASDGSAGQAH